MWRGRKRLYQCDNCKTLTRGVKPVFGAKIRK